MEIYVPVISSDFYGHFGGFPRDPFMTNRSGHCGRRAGGGCGRRDGGFGRQFEQCRKRLAAAAAAAAAAKQPRTAPNTPTDSSSNDEWITPAEFINALFGIAEKMREKTTETQKAANGAPTAEAKPEDEGKSSVFEVKLNVAEYKPEELKVKISPSGLLTIEGKHEETKTKKDEAGKLEDEQFVSMHFRRNFTLPENIIEEQLVCRLSDDGKELIVSAPLKAIEPPAPTEEQAKSIPIQIVQETGKSVEGEAIGTSAVVEPVAVPAAAVAPVETKELVKNAETGANTNN